ncbi:hypothetical protein GA0061096_0526 [Fictibacillus enclensis]|uniref:Uncharacterized protein n=1 Tax=Fictibacillus enclensis TaxID=1017270 RepID=A0A0V8JB86_9BACL|nr:hypothetical protein AS030_02475 [Fictibacillus enclensis]SCB79440.1 hypothetical protein GA0061096_0526 [Fictibacillus enclensis]
MIYQVIVGLIIPWMVGTYLCFKKPKFMLMIVPIGISTAFLINDWGFNYFWRLKHSYKNLSLASVPYNIGLFPILGCLFISSIHYTKLNTFLSLILFTIFTTLIEFWALKEGEIIYRNGWNIGFTAISYFIGYLVVFIYYKLLRKYKIL